MSHFAKIENGVVMQVIVADQSFINDGFVGNPNEWIQTSYNTRGGIHYDQNNNPDGGIALRANYAGIGYIYDSINDVFYSQRPLDRNGLPCDSWTISSPTWLWKPPISKPESSNLPSVNYSWDEPTKSWIEEIPQAI